jgi:hypothetical protein
MSNQKSLVLKIGGYFLIGFFTLIIIISFGMPDFISRFSLDKSTVAIVNGEKLHVYDFLRYRDNIYRQYGRNEQMDPFILNQFIGEILIVQEGIKYGFEPTDDRIANYIKSIPIFKDAKTGAYDGKKFKDFLAGNKFTFGEFNKILKRDLIKEDFLQYLKMGIAVTKDEINFNQLTSNGKIKVKYAFLSGEDLKKRFIDKIAVTDNEISDEMAKNKSELKDPKTDRARIKQKLTDAKLAEVKKELLEKLNVLADKKASFNESSALLNGTVKITKEFTPGAPILEDTKESQPVTQIENSKVFREQFLSLEKGIASAPIEAANGIYIITPELKDIKQETLKEEERVNLSKKLEYQKINALSQNLLASLMEKSKITKTKSFDKN